MTRKHSHYHKDVSRLESIDVYRVIDLFGVTDGAAQHALKKLLCAGQRGSKTFEQDIREAHDTLARRLQMFEEDREGDRVALSEVPGVEPFVEAPAPIPTGRPACTVCGDKLGHFGGQCPRTVTAVVLNEPTPQKPKLCIRIGCYNECAVGNFCNEHSPL